MKRINEYYVSVRKAGSKKPLPVSRLAKTLEEAKTLARNILEEKPHLRCHVFIKRTAVVSGYKPYAFRDPVGVYARATPGNKVTYFSIKRYRMIMNSRKEA